LHAIRVPAALAAAVVLEEEHAVPVLQGGHQRGEGHGAGGGVVRIGDVPLRNRKRPVEQAPRGAGEEGVGIRGAFHRRVADLPVDGIPRAAGKARMLPVGVNIGVIAGGGDDGR